MIGLGMGAGPGVDAQCLLAEDALGHTAGHKPRHAKTYRDFRSEHDRLQRERIAAFGEPEADVHSGACPESRRVVPIEDGEFGRFTAAAEVALLADLAAE